MSRCAWLAVAGDVQPRLYRAESGLGQSEWRLKLKGAQVKGSGIAEGVRLIRGGGPCTYSLSLIRQGSGFPIPNPYTGPYLAPACQEPNDVAMKMSSLSCEQDSLRAIFAAADSIWALKFGSRDGFDKFKASAKHAF